MLKSEILQIETRNQIEMHFGLMKLESWRTHLFLFFFFN